MITESVQKKKNYLFQEEMVISIIYFLNILADTWRTVKL